MASPAGKSKDVRSTPKRAKLKRRLKTFFYLFLIAMMTLFIVGSIVAFPRLQKAKMLVANIDEVMEELSNQPSIIESADGEVLYTIQTEYRKAVDRADLPNAVVDAMVAAEDKRFWTHPGVDVKSLFRILFKAARDRSTRESGGGSTLTMQIAKRVYTGDAFSIERKLDNMALAIEIERTLTKDQILALYLNQVYFGEQAYGIAAAADVYFGKKLDELTVAEAALLARCVRRPSDENPFKNLDKSIENRNIVLAIMEEEGYISHEEYKRGIEEPVKLRKDRSRNVTHEKVHPYFVDYVLHDLDQKGIDISAGGYRVVTTLNSQYQTIAEKGVAKWVKEFKNYRVNQMAALITDNNGRILCMVGGPDYKKSEFNPIWMGQGRQPGSSFKPFVFATGLARGVFDESSRISTKPMKKPFSNEYFQGGANRGNVSIPVALATSNNTATVRAMDEVGPKNVVRYCKQNFGFKRSNLPAVISVALGSGEVYMTELAEAYNVFQNHGDRYPVYAIQRITHPDGSVENLTPRKVTAAVDTSVADYIDASLRRTVVAGTGSQARGVANARGKTGTTSDHKDAWFCGYTDRLVGIVWTANEQIVNGRPTAAPMRGLFGGQGPARVWNDIVGDIQKKVGEKPREFARIGKVTAEPQEEEPVEEVPVEEPPVEIPEEPEIPVDPSVVTPIEPPTSEPGGNKPPANSGNTGGRDIVYVVVCADTSQRATPYCPETVRRPFFKGSEPKGMCPVHKPGDMELAGFVRLSDLLAALRTPINR